MKLDRFRAPALAATAVLLISGAANAFAASPPATISEPVNQVTQVEPVGPDTDTVQEGDQTTPDVAGVADTTVESVDSDTDTLQEGDQTSPDVAGAEAPEAAGAEAPDAAGAEAPEAAGTEADGPGGHADADGANVDHQFDGQE